MAKLEIEITRVGSFTYASALGSKGEDSHVSAAIASLLKALNSRFERLEQVPAELLNEQGLADLRALKAVLKPTYSGST
jgi:hypothetical protein